MLKATPRYIPADYVSQSPELQPFYRYGIQSTDWERVIEDCLSKAYPRESVQQALTEQYGGLGKIPAPVAAHIQALVQPNTVCITTGQQAGLAGGPLFVLYKALSVLLLAEELQHRFPQYHFVPLFWVASEDHDAAEVNHFYASYQQPYQYIGNIAGPVGRHIIDGSIEQLWFADEVMRSFWQPGVRWSSAFIATMRHLFDDWGLVVLEPDSRQLKTHMVPYWEQEIGGLPSYPRLMETSDALASAGYSQQLHPRSINLFYLTDALRTRIEADDSGRFTTVEGGYSWSKSELQSEMRQFPERFSPNAALRPIYQQAILPNIAYIGGWGEISYWMQLMGAFDQWEVFYPVVLPRHRGLLLSVADYQQWHELGWTISDIQLTEKALKRLVWQKHGKTAAISDSMGDVRQTLASLSSVLGGVHDSLSQHVNTWPVSRDLFWRRLEDRLAKVWLSRNPDLIMPSLRLKRRIQPDGMIQERLLSIGALPLSVYQTALSGWFAQLKRESQHSVEEFPFMNWTNGKLHSLQYSD
jgi:bacillithiol synthase